MERINLTNDQAAFEYVLYMIAASYFDKATCVTGLTERNLLLHYKEQKANTQFDMENYCIKFMDLFEKRLGKQFFARRVNVRLIREKEGRPISVIFSGDDMELKLSATYRKNHSIIRYSAVLGGAKNGQ